MSKIVYQSSPLVLPCPPRCSVPVPRNTPFSPPSAHALSYALPCSLPLTDLSCPVTSRPAPSCPAQPPYPALPCRALPYLTLTSPMSFSALPCLFLRFCPRLPPCPGAYHPPSSTFCRTLRPALALPPSCRLLCLALALQLFLQHQSFCVATHSGPCLACCALHPALA